MQALIKATKLTPIRKFIHFPRVDTQDGKALPTDVESTFKEMSILIQAHYEGQPPRHLLELLTLHLHLSEPTIRVCEAIILQY